MLVNRTVAAATEPQKFDTMLVTAWRPGSQGHELKPVASIWFFMDWYQQLPRSMGCWNSRLESKLSVLVPLAWRGSIDYSSYFDVASGEALRVSVKNWAQTPGLLATISSCSDSEACCCIAVMCLEMRQEDLGSPPQSDIQLVHQQRNFKDFWASIHCSLQAPQTQV